MQSVVYDSDLIIRDASYLAALCIFYDQVMLPWMPAEGVHKFVRLWRSVGGDGEAFYEVDMIGTEDFGDFHLNWDREMKVLFENGVLRRLAPIDETFNFDSVEELAMILLELGANISIGGGDGKPFIKGYYAARLFHSLRRDFDPPRLFNMDESGSRELTKFLQAQASFAYLLPALKEINLEQILAVRERVSDTREGFMLHLQKLSSGVDLRARGGESPADIARYARAVVETDLIPDYEEFGRQISAERLSFGASVLDAGAKVLRIEAPVTSPRFYAGILEALGVPWTSSLADRRESLSNRSLALQFLRRTEEVLSP